MLSPSGYILSRASRLVVLLLCLAACLDATAHADLPSLSLTRGDLPLVLVAGHGGTLPLDGAEVRQAEKVSDPNFVIFGDARTNELATDLAATIAALYQDKHRPSLLLNRIHRRYADVNRKPEQSSHDRLGTAHHTEFHRQLAQELERLVQEHGWALLLDIHGQSRYPTTLLLGTAENAVIGEWSKATIWGEQGLVERLSEAGFSAEPSTPDGKQRYGGGYTIRHHGRAQGVEAWQLEHSRDIRDALDERTRYLELVADILVEALEQRQEQP